MTRVAGVERGPGDFQFLSLWYPDGEIITKALAHRLEHEAFYRADQFHDAMRYVSRWGGAVDCGAHVGAWSRELARRFGRVVAIEPHPAAARCLAKNLEAWPHATVVNCALGARHGFVNMGAAKGTLDSEVTAGDGIAVPMRRLDDVLGDLGMAAVDYLKIHVNGYELAVLDGARETLARHRPVMTVVVKKALANYGTTPEQVFNFMNEMGYRVVSRLKPYWVFAA